MSAMKKLQPEMLKIRENYKDDRAKQQQAIIALYKKDKVNPLSGCIPIWNKSQYSLRFTRYFCAPWK